MNGRLRGVLLATLASIVPVAALILAPSPAVAGSRLPEAGEWVHFTRESGLPSERVEKIVETPAGSVWALTSEGLVWYDGFEWIRATGDIESECPHERNVEPYGRDRILVVCSNGRLLSGDRTGLHRIALTVNDEHLLLANAVETSDGRALLEFEDTSKRTSPLIFLRDGEKLKQVETPSPAAHPGGLASLVRTESGQVFLRTATGLFRMVAGGWTAVNAKEPWTEAQSVAEGAGGDGFSYVRTPTRALGLWEWSHGGPAHRCTGWTGNTAMAMTVAPNGDTVIAYDNGGVQ